MYNSRDAQRTKNSYEKWNCNGEHFSKVRAPEARDGAQWVGRLSSSQKALSSVPSKADTRCSPGTRWVETGRSEAQGQASSTT